MRATAKVLRISALAVLVVVAALGGLFAAGNAVSDLPPATAITGVVLWLAVAGGLSLLAWRAPDRAVPVLTGVVGLVAVLAGVDRQVDLFDRDVNGPVMVVVLLSVLVPLGLLGLVHPLAAGVLLLVPPVVLLAAALVPVGGGGGAPPVGALLTGSGGVLVTPMVLAGVLFSVAGMTARGARGPVRRGRPRSAVGPT